MIFDILLLLIVAGFIFFCVRRDVVKSLSSFLTAALSCFAATIIGRLLANWSYKTFVEPAIHKAVDNAVEKVSSDLSANIASALPSWISALLGQNDGDLSELFVGPISQSKGVIVDAVDTAVYPVVIALLTFFITILLFFAFLMLTRRFLLKPLHKAIRLPFTERATKIFSGVVGFLGALLLITMSAYLLKLLVANIGFRSTWLTEENINKSFIFKMFYSGNIFTWVTSLISGK